MRSLSNGGVHLMTSPLAAMSHQSPAYKKTISLGTFHEGQARAYWALHSYRFKALRCGRRFGKTDLANTWIAEGLLSYGLKLVTA